jgi:hypothetical protein
MNSAPFIPYCGSLCAGLPRAAGAEAWRPLFAVHAGTTWPWDGKGCFVVHMVPQPAGRVLDASDQTVHGIRVEMKI